MKSVDLKKRNGKSDSGTSCAKKRKRDDDVVDDDGAAKKAKLKIEVEFVPEEIDFGDLEPEFKGVLENFRAMEEKQGGDGSGEAILGAAPKVEEAGQNGDVDQNGGIESAAKITAPLSKRSSRKAKRISIAQLKQIVQRPDVVEAEDVASSDPVFLIRLKSMRNTVPVPRHWCAKSKYLHGKVGFVKKPWELPPFIADTGIAKIRDETLKGDEQKSLKAKGRQAMRPKMGKIDIDYQVLHDAFFKHQTKPPLTIIGELYYEGKEFETRAITKRPGHLSSTLMDALGMLSADSPPPWLINQQRYGPPPAYPNLKIPGLNAPIPPGSTFGYHPGGWGRPPVDSNGIPLYGDVFGTDAPAGNDASAVDKKFRWGAIEDEAPSDSDDDDSEDEGEDVDDDDDGKVADVQADDSNAADRNAVADGLGDEDVTAPFAYGSDGIELRKGVAAANPANISAGEQDARAEQDEKPKELFKVLEQTEKSIGNDVYGASHGYVVPPAGEGTRSVSSSPPPIGGKGKAKKTKKAKKYKEFKF